MAERLRLIYCTLAALCFVPMVSCKITQQPESKGYTTIAADPNRDTEAAVKLHEKAFKLLERTSNPAHYQCTCVANAVCNAHKAEQLLHDALVADVRYGPAHNTLGLVYYHQRRLHLAAWEFQFAADLMPRRAEPLNNLGMVYEEAGQFDQALQFYMTAMEITPNNPEYVANFARAHLRSGKDLESIRGLLQQLLLQDTRPEWIGWACDLLGEKPLSHNFSGVSSNLADDSEANVHSELIPKLPVEELPFPRLAPIN